MWFLSVIRWVLFMYSRNKMWGLFGFSHSSNAFTYGRDISCHSAIQSFYVQLRHFVSLNHRKFLCTVETFCVISQLSKVWTYSWDVLCDFSTIQSFSYSWDSLCNFSTTETFYVQIRHFVWFFNHPKICRTVEKFMTVMTFFVVSQLSKVALVRSLTFCVVSEHLCAVSVFTLNSHRKLTEIAKPAVT